MGTKILTPSNLKTMKFTVSGLDEYMEKVRKAGNNVDDAVAECIDELKENIREDIQDWAVHRVNTFTGAVSRSVEATGVIREGNRIYAEVGIDGSKEPGGWHAVFEEYGTPTQPANPGIRPAFEKWRGKSKAIFKRILTKWGVPVD